MPTWRCSRRASPGWPSSTTCITSPTAGPTTTSPRCRSGSLPQRPQVGIGLTLLPVLYRQSGFGGKPPSEAQRRFLNDRDSYARIMETKVPGGRIGIAPALVARRDARRSQMGRRHLARPACAHPCQRADARGRRLPRRARPPTDRPADGHRRGRRALVPRPCHSCRCRRTRPHRQGKGGRRPLPDHRGQSRRRPVRRAGLPRPGRPLRRRLGLQRAHLRRRRTAHARIRPAPDPSPAQRAGRREPIHRPPTFRSCAGRWRTGRRFGNDRRHRCSGCRGTSATTPFSIIGCSPPTTRPSSRSSAAACGWWNRDATAIVTASPDATGKRSLACFRSCARSCSLGPMTMTPARRERTFRMRRHSLA